MSKPSQYRDERGVRIQKYRRFKEGEDYEGVQPDEMVALIDNMIDNMEVYNNRVRIGQPPKYESLESFQSIVTDYMNYIKDANIDGVKLIPDVEGLCAFMGISRETLNTWEHSRDPRYSDSIKTVKNQIAFFKKQLALKGKIPPIVFATDFNNNHGYTQKQELVLTPNNPLGSADPGDVRKAIEALPKPSDSTD